MSTATCRKSSKSKSKSKCAKYVYFFGNGKAEGDAKMKEILGAALKRAKCNGRSTVMVRDL